LYSFFSSSIIAPPGKGNKKRLETEKRPPSRVMAAVSPASISETKKLHITSGKALQPVIGGAPRIKSLEIVDKIR
jgi:hypothetical protein